MDGKPNVFVEIDSETVVVGFDGKYPLQVWDVAAGKLVRELAGRGTGCYSMVRLPGGRIAVGRHEHDAPVVAVYNLNSGKQVQQLTGFIGPTYGLAFVEGHLLTVSTDRSIRVWSQHSAGTVSRKRQCVRAN